MIYKTFRNSRPFFWGFIFAVCFNACKKNPVVRPEQTIPFRKDELIIVYPPNLTQSIRADIRKTLLSNYKIDKTSICPCDSSIELIHATQADTFINDSTAVRTSTSHETIVLNGNKVIVSKNVQLKGLPVSISPGITPASYSMTRGAVRIAIIDSGLDTANYFTASSYNNFLLPSSATNYSLVGIKDPALISHSRYFGWNFIKNNQDIMDDNIIKHGTHVTGLVLGQAKNNGPEVIPLKVSDATGVSDLSSVLCALKFAELAKVNIVNASWGYDGVSNLALENALRSLSVNKILLVAAAGNDDHDIAVDPHYPGSFSGDPAHPLDNIITVTAATSSGVCVSENYSRIHVDVGVAGQPDNCSYASPFYPGSPGIILPSSSFSTAIMTGIIANKYTGIPIATGTLKNNVLDAVLGSVSVSPALGSKIRTSKRLTQQ